MDNVLEAFVTTVRAEKQMRDLSIDTPDLFVQYESMLTYIKQHGFTLTDIKCALEPDAEYQMDWIRDMWNNISLFKYKVSVTYEVWATDEDSAAEMVAEMVDSNHQSIKVEEVGK